MVVFQNCGIRKSHCRKVELCSGEEKKSVNGRMVIGLQMYSALLSQRGEDKRKGMDIQPVLYMKKRKTNQF